MKKEYEWLPELNGTIPNEAFGYAVSVYSIAYEAWRRGLTVSFKNIYHRSGKFEPRYSISSGDNKLVFTHTRPNVVSKEAIDICVNKQKTREFLAEKNVNVPQGLVLSSLNESEIKKSINHLDFPLVIKPLDGKGGRGVITGIDDFKELFDNINYLKNDLNINEIIVEEYIEGEDYRAFVIGDKVIGAFRRLPPHVIGDGKNSIKELLKRKNQIRVKIPGTYNMKVTINEEVKRELAKQDYNINSIPSEGEFVRLKTKNNVSSGGDPIDATQELPEDVKKDLVQAVKSVPGLLQGGVDVIYDKSTGRHAVLEINTRPSIRNHLYPIKGKAHPIPRAIIDYYFPETTGIDYSETTPRYYFDYVFVKEHILNNRLKSFTLPDHPYEPNLISRKIEFYSKQEIDKLQKFVRRRFHKMLFNGELNLVKKNRYEITIAGNSQDVAYFIDQLKSKKYISKVKESPYTKPIRVGFTFNDHYIGDSKMLKKVSQKDKEIRKLKKEITKMKDSKSWKLTAPLRIKSINKV